MSLTLKGEFTTQNTALTSFIAGPMHGDKGIESSSDKIMGKHIEELHLGIKNTFRN